MQNTRKTKIISFFTVILLALLFVSCSQDVIFYDIAREVKLVNPEINGNIFSIVPLDGQLYVQNGNIFTKNPASAHGWKLVSKPEAAGNVRRLASDAQYLYAMNESGTVWTMDLNGSWTKIADNVSGLFDDQTVSDNCMTTGRTAYITNESGIYILNGTEPLENLLPPTSAADTFGRPDSEIKAAVKVGTTTVFSSNTIICASGTTLYSVNNKGTFIRFKTEGGSWTDGGTVAAGALSICSYGTDKILIGTEKGYEICTIDSTSKRPSNGIVSATNAESAFGTRQVITIRSFGTSVYAAVVSEVSSDYSKLWSWFGTDWNYE